MLKLKTVNGEVEVIAPAGSAFVRYKMPESKAKAIIGANKAEKSDKFPGFGICVGGEYYFAGSMTAEKAEEVAEEKPKKKTTSKKK